MSVMEAVLRGIRRGAQMGIDPQPTEMQEAAAKARRQLENSTSEAWVEVGNLLDQQMRKPSPQITSTRTPRQAKLAS